MEVALMLNIWLNLAIKSTVRFRCVSKSWCASLSDPHFIYKNLTLPDAANEHDLQLLVNEELPHYSVVSHETLTATPLQLPPEVPDPVRSLNIHIITPPLDDLVCFYHYFRHHIGVWNITTGETMVYDDGDFSSELITLGFGFDEKTKDYKIVKILYEDDHFVAYVYSLSSPNNWWRKVGEPDMHFMDYGGPFSACSRSYNYRDGTFYWGSRDLIVSFDLSTEVFNTISIPPVDGWSSGFQEICKLKERSMLIITDNYYWEKDRKQYEIWALLELGVTQSWTKLLVIDCGIGEDKTLGLWRNELIFRSSNGRLLISDPFKLEPKEVQIDEPRSIVRCLHGQKGKNTFRSIV